MVRDRVASPQTLRVFEALLDASTDWHYGYDLSKRTDLRSGTLYPILARLADRGLLDSRWEPPQRHGRPPRHVYRLTAEGVRAAHAALARANAGRSHRRQPGLSTTPIPESS